MKTHLWMSVAALVIVTVSCKDRTGRPGPESEDTGAARQRNEAFDPSGGEPGYGVLESQIAQGKFEGDLIRGLEAMARRNPQGVLSLMDRISETNRPFFELVSDRVLVQLIGNGHAAEARDWFSRHVDLHDCGQIEEFYRWLAKNRPELAADWCERLTGRARTRTRLIALSHMCKTGRADDALAYLSKIGGKDLGMCCAQIVVCCQQSRNYETALAAWRKIPGDFAKRDELLNQSFHGWLGSDYGEAVKAMESLGPAEIRSLLTSDPVLLTMLSNNGGEVILSQSRKLPFSKDFLPAFAKVSGLLGSADVGIGMRVLEVVPAGEGRDMLVRDLYAKAALHPGWSAEKLPAAGERDRMSALRGVAGALAVVDYAKAMACAEMVAADERQTIYREVATALVREDCNGAVRMIENPAVEEKLGDGFRGDMIDHTVRNWAKQDLSAAQQWVEKLPEADAAKGYQGLMTSWMKTDPVAASEWLSKQALGPARDAGAKVLIEQIKDTDPEMAEQWRKSLTAPAGK